MADARNIAGDCPHVFSAVAEAFAHNFDVHDEVGASVAVVVDGRLAVDLWGGHVDRARTTPWHRDTITNVWSTTKTMSSLAALVLASRGALDLDAPVAAYWPEFAANGKGGVLVRHVLSHSAGLPAWDEHVAANDLVDRERLCAMLAAQAPLWAPGTRSGYHMLTHGYLVGELVRRVDGRTLAQYFADEIAVPLGADFHIVVDPRDDHRVAPMIPASPASAAGDAVASTADAVARATANVTLLAADSATPEWRRAEIPAAAGHGNARGVALAQSVVSAAGTVGDRRYLSPEVLDRVFEVQAAGRDLVLGVGVTFGIGYALNSQRAPISPNRRVCYWGGWGGSLVVNDVDAGFTLAYVMNRMGPGTLGDERAAALLAAVYESLEIKAIAQLSVEQ